MTTPDVEDEFTELVDFRPDRVDLVGKGANGIPRFLIAKQDAAAGLLEPEFVRGLIAKASPQEAPVPDPADTGEASLPNGIVLKGSPADIAAFFHAASARPAEEPVRVPTPADVAKAKNDTADRKAKASSGAAMPDGSYPIESEADLAKAIKAVGRGGADHDAIRKHIISRARSLGASSDIPDNWNADGSLKGDVAKEADVAEAAVAKDIMDAAGDGVPIDDGLDGMDPTVPFAAPADEADLPGDPTDPGSPAWEGIDAATAHKWLAIAARLKNALLLLSERETLEAASADPDDIENAWNLQDAAGAVDYAISQLAVFASGEKAEAEIGAETVEMCKALASVPAGQLDVVEGLTAVAKSGRALSAANEAKIRSAAEALQQVLSSLPQAPDGVAKQKEAAMPAPETVTAPAGPQAAPAAAPADPAAQAPAPVAKAARPVLVYDRAGAAYAVTPDAIVTTIAKADADTPDKPKMQAVFDADGNLIGVVDPDAITPVAGSTAAPATDPAPAADDMTPQPPAAAGTAAGDVAKAAGGTPDAAAPLTQDVLKSVAEQAARAALEAREAAHAEVVAKMAADNAGLAGQLEAVEKRLATVEAQPAAPRVFANGQRPGPDDRPVPPPGQLRGQDAGAPAVDVAKAAELRAEFATAAPARQNQLAAEMQEAAIAGLSAIHAAR